MKYTIAIVAALLSTTVFADVGGVKHPTNCDPCSIESNSNEDKGAAGHGQTAGNSAGNHTGATDSTSVAHVPAQSVSANKAAESRKQGWKNNSDLDASSDYSKYQNQLINN